MLQSMGSQRVRHSVTEHNPAAARSLQNSTLRCVLKETCEFSAADSKLSSPPVLLSQLTFDFGFAEEGSHSSDHCCHLLLKTPHRAPPLLLRLGRDNEKEPGSRISAQGPRQPLITRRRDIPGELCAPPPSPPCFQGHRVTGTPNCDWEGLGWPEAPQPEWSATPKGGLAGSTESLMASSYILIC